MFFPYEHIYVFVDNYDLNLSIFIIIFLIFSIFSFFIFLKKKIIFINWYSLDICKFNITSYVWFTRKGFPLISNLAERYQYSSIVGLVIISTWLIKNFKNNFQKILFIRGFLIIILILFVIILNDRSKVYVNNSVFMSQIDENSPRNTHRYAFSTAMTNAIFADDAKNISSTFINSIRLIHHLS